ncbi:MAG: response regulator [Magnetococcales bacterium]|nr:response regulator [Magnetococcales bacterium]
MLESIKVLVVASLEEQGLSPLRALEKEGLQLQKRRFVRPSQAAKAILADTWDLILICDFDTLPQRIELPLSTVVPTTPVIVCSAQVTVADAVQLLRQGIWDCLIPGECARLAESFRQGRRALAERHQEALRRDQVHETFRLLAEQSPVGIFQTNPRGECLFVNNTLADLIGQERENLLGDGWVAYLHPEDRVRVVNTLRLVEGSEPVATSLELRLLNDAGEIFWVVSHANPLFNEDGVWEGFIGTIADLSPLREAEKELREAMEEAASGTRAKTEFLSVMSHEIRTPMNAILGMADLLATTELTGEQQAYLEVVKETGRGLLKLLNDILELARADAESALPPWQEFNLRELVQGVMDLYLMQANGKGLVLFVDVAAQVPVVVQAEPRLLRVVLSNLVGNAVKFTNEGSITLRVEPDPRAGADLLCFSIHDTGIGIPADKLEMIFEPFTQVDSSSSRSFGGTGLGLAICRKFVERLGGRLWVESMLGEGSVFKVLLPCREGVSLEEEPETAEAPQEEVGLDPAQVKILLVEDDPVNQLLLTRMLQQMGYNVALAADGREALEQMSQVEFDLVFMDCLMPHMDGFTATRKWRNRERKRGEAHLPVVALTALALQGDREKCLESGMDDYLAKPVQSLELAGMIHRWVGNGHRREPRPTMRPSLEMVNFEDLREEMGGDLGPVVEIFLDILPQRLGAIREALGRKDADTLHLEAHSLKSSCRQLGLVGLAELAMEMDILARSKRFKMGERLFSKLKTEARRTVEPLREACRSFEE